MLELSFLGFKYARLIASGELGQTEVKQLKNNFSNVNLVSYQSQNLPGFQELNKKAVLINLPPSLEEIFSTFKDNTRNEINKTNKIEGLKFVWLDKNFKALHKLHKSFDLKRGWMPAPKIELEKSLVFSAYFKNKPISVVTCFTNDKVIRILELFSARYEKNQEYESPIIGYATRRVIYEICKYGKEQGFTMFDLGGINLEDPAKAGVAKFKQSFGGRVVDVYFYIYITRAFKILKNILKLFKLDIPS